MARTGWPADRSVLCALGLSDILMETLFFLLLLFFIHLGGFVEIALTFTCPLGGLKS